MLLGRFRWGVVLVVGVLFGGTVGYRVIEGWGWLDSAWMVLITLTTIGYSETHPLSDAGRLFTMGLIVVGVGLGTYAVGKFTRWMVEGDLARAFAVRRKRRVMNRLEGHYIVVGLGRLGSEVAEELHSRGRKVVGIDPTPSGHELQFLTMLLEDDGSSDDVLREAAVGRADGLAVSTGSDALNIFITLTARQLNPKLHIVARVDEATSVQKAIRAGANAVVNPYGIGGARMAQGLVNPHAAELVDQAVGRGHAGFQIEDVPIGGAEAYHGPLGELDIPDRHGILIVAIRKPSGELITALDRHTKLDRGDIAIVVGRSTDVADFATATAGD